MDHGPIDGYEFTTGSGEPVRTVTAAEMRRLDAEAERAGYQLRQMVEHAGRHLADLAHERGGWADVTAPRVVVLAGGGGNGAGVLAAARLLANAGGRVRVLRAGRDAADGTVVANQLQLLRATDAEFLAHGATVPSGADLVLDGLVGYGLSGALRRPHRRLVEETSALYAAGELVIALDVPSGLNADDGSVEGVAIRPTATMTVGMPKHGLLHPAAGDIWLADIGIPRGVHDAASVPTPPRSLPRTGLLPLSRSRLPVND